jgi:hypothetical protein
MKWEYKIEPTKAAYVEKRLNELGSAGWELVAVTEFAYYFKRECRDFGKPGLKPPKKA